MWTDNFQTYNGFRKGSGTRDQIANICWIIEKARKFQTNIYFCFVDHKKALNCVDHNQLWKILRDGNTRPIWPCFLRSLYAGQEAWNKDMEQWAGSKLAKEYIKAIYCHPANLTYICRVHHEMLGWMNFKLESWLPGERSTMSDMQITSPLWQKVKRD